MGRGGNIRFSFFTLTADAKQKQVEALGPIYLHSGMREVFERNAAIILEEGSRAAL